MVFLGGVRGGRKGGTARSDGEGTNPDLEGLQVGTVTVFSGRALQSAMVQLEE